MKILIIGSGGREHALAWKAAASPLASQVFVAPGNAGTAGEPGVRNIPIPADDIEALCQFAQDNAIDLTIPGPENPLVAGIVDRFTKAGLACFGPTRAAAVLEGSKSFTKDFLRRHGIPTADYACFTEIEPALRYLQSRSLPIVVKADGLAGGKGVVIAETMDEAEQVVLGMLSGDRLGAAGNRVVIEEFLRGEEASFIVMCDGRIILPLASSQDHKARDDGDRGPNTGGMGAYSPAPVVTPEIHDRIMREVIEPTVAGMRAEGRTYTGFLYAGVMLTSEGIPKVLEFNCRFGDPETQPILMRMQGDIVELCRLAVAGQLDQGRVSWDERAAVGVVLAAAGYPASPRKGDVIQGLEGLADPGVKVFHASTVTEGDRIVTAGGRVFCVTALGEDVTRAQARAYQTIARIQFTGMHYRRDIGYRAIARERSVTGG